MVQVALGIARLGGLILTGIGIGTVLDFFDSDNQPVSPVSFGTTFLAGAIVTVGVIWLAKKAIK